MAKNKNNPSTIINFEIIITKIVRPKLFDKESKIFIKHLNAGLD